MGVVYRKRQSYFQKREDEYRAEDDALVWRRSEAPERRYPWNGVVHVRATFAGSRLKPWRHVFVVTFRNGQNLKIDNGHFDSIGNFEDRSQAYCAFVRAAIEKIARDAPHAHASIGERPWTYYLELAMVAALFALLAVIIVLLPVDLSGGLYITRFALIILMLPMFFVWVARARPRGVKLDPAAFADGLPAPEKII